MATRKKAEPQPETTAPAEKPAAPKRSASKAAAEPSTPKASTPKASAPEAAEPKPAATKSKKIGKLLKKNKSRLPRKAKKQAKKKLLASHP